MGTTKLTRKEILAEDPVHEAMIRLVEFFQENGKKIAVAAVVAVLLAVAVYAGIEYLGQRQEKAQAQLARGISFFHGKVAADATDDPFAKDATPTFRDESAKYKAAAKEFSAVASGIGSSQISVVARYYLGLSQLQLGEKKEAVRNLENVASNSRVRTVGYLAKRVLAAEYMNSGNQKGAREILEGMIRDPQCDLPKEDLNIDLARVLAAQGKRDEAIKVLRDASAQGPQFSLLKQRLSAELEKLQKTSAASQKP